MVLGLKRLLIDRTLHKSIHAELGDFGNVAPCDSPAVAGLKRVKRVRTKVFCDINGRIAFHHATGKSNGCAMMVKASNAG